jgi:hypothetical protein
MKKFLLFVAVIMLNACSTSYVLMDDKEPVLNEVDRPYSEAMIGEERLISGNDVFVVGEGDDFVTYQYRNVRVDEISPLASLYCADVSYGGSPYLREVSIFHNGFMRATFDCVSLAI